MKVRMLASSYASSSFVLFLKGNGNESYFELLKRLIFFSKKKKKKIPWIGLSGVKVDLKVDSPKRKGKKKSGISGCKSCN